ncbi:MAG: RNA polymerase subunit sigma-70, partial [Bacteroidaceae bacterium]|nr:RNA polymerase subunit sigma-70 [Bacteroidaceae bacterium]
MIATISADIVRSTSMNTEDLIVLRNKLRGLFQDFEEDYPGFWARIVRGDSIECVVPNYNDALRIAILIKLYVKMRVSGFDCSEMLQRYGIRFSIGVADIKYADKKEDIINGPA